MKNTRKLILLLLLMLMFCSVLPIKASTWLPTASKWTIVTVDSLAYNPCLKLDSNNQPHISYKNLEEDDLKYAVLRGNSWAVTTVDSNHYTGYEPSLAIDNKNRPHITYGVLWIHGFEPVSNGSSIITNMGLNNHITAFSLSETSSVQNHISLNEDSPNSYDYLNFDISTDYLKYAFWDGGSWNITTVFEDTGDHHSSLALDSKDRPHISYDDSCLKLVVWDGSPYGSPWTITTVDLNDAAGARSSLVLDSNDIPHICYYEDTNNSYYDRTNGILKYAKFNGTDWEIMNVDKVGDLIEINLMLDSNNRPHISYCDSVNHTLKYAFLEGDSWNITRINPDSLVGTYSSLALDSKDRPHICYCDVTNSTYYDPSNGTQKQSYDNGVLMYARFTGTVWKVMTADSCFHDPSLMLDGNDQPHISYTTPNSDLKYAVLVATSPTAPLNLQVTAENGNISLNWSAPSFDGESTVTNYKIYRGTASGNGTLLTTVGNVTFFVDGLVENDITYYYQVSAVNSVGEGAKSNEVTATLYQSVFQAYLFYIILIALALVIGSVVTITVVRRLSLKSAK